MPEISVIVPVYNTEEYLRRCIDSILAQTFTDFELILVDDGSTDNSGKICDEYAQTDKRVRVFHNENGGVSSARNFGLDMAQGKYIMFSDSDDVVSQYWISRLMEHLDVDTLAVGGYCNSKEKLGQVFNLKISYKVSSQEYYKYKIAGIAGYVCNCIFCKHIININSLRFREIKNSGDFNEDLVFVLQYVKLMKYVSYTGYTDYFYDNHTDSLSHIYVNLYFKKYEEKFKLWYDFLMYVRDIANVENLATSSIYYFITFMCNEVSFAIQDKNISEHYLNFQNIVNSDSVQKCVRYSKCKNENQNIISLIKKRATFRLWVLLYLSKLKGILHK